MATAIEDEQGSFEGISDKILPGIVKGSKCDVNIVVMGKAGEGKSAIINALCGAVVEESTGEAKLPAGESSSTDHATTATTPYLARKTKVTTIDTTPKVFTVNVWDSPGLFDGTGSERGYLLQIKHKCEEPDLFLYCINMSRRRAIVREMEEGMRLVNELLGERVWEHCLIILTYSNNVNLESLSADDMSKEFLTKLGKWQDIVQQALVNSGVHDETAKNMPIEPAGYYTNPHLPHCEHWLGSLWLVMLRAAKQEAQFSIFVNTQNYIKNAEYFTPNLDQANIDSVIDSMVEHGRPIIIDEITHGHKIDKLIGPIKRLVKRLMETLKKRKTL